MSAPPEPTKPATSSAPESPTTARPLEMDDDDVQETGVIAGDVSPPTPTHATPVGSEPAPPPKPPRPVSEQQVKEQTLKEAFPTVELPVIKAVLSASRGNIEAAFNALLEMTDPDAVRADPEDAPPPPQPPRPAPGTAGLSQVEADELYARQLAEHYENVGSYEARTANRGGRGGGGGGDVPYHSRTRQQTGLKPNELYDDREHSFIDDDLPVIRDNLKKGFIETQVKVNNWFTDLKKKIDKSLDELDEGYNQQQQKPAGAAGRPGESSRRSGDYERYDADPQVLSDDFAGMKFAADGTPLRDDRPLANPNLFKPPPPSTSPKPSDGRRVAFRDGAEEIDVYDASPRLPPKDGTGGASTPPAAAAKASKWQPLSTVEPSPIADNDPFSLGDSEDEKDAKSSPAKGGEIKMEDSERLRKAAAEAMADSLVEDKPKGGDTAAAAAKKE